MIHDRHKIRHAHIAIERSHAHGQFVAEIAQGRQPHPRNAQMLAQSGGRFHVVFVEGNNAIQFMRAGQMGHCLHDVGQCNIFRKVEGLVETFARPVGIAQFFGGQQNHAAALALALAHEFLSLFVGSDAKDCQQARVRHGLGSGIRHRRIP